MADTAPLFDNLTSAFRSDGGYNHSYNYDSFGNLAVQDNINSSPVWDVDPATNQLLHNPVAGVTDSYGHPLNDFTYDYAGNMVSSGTFPIGHAYQYNALNQIISVDNGGTATYDYNGDDERAVKHTPTGWTQYIYFGGQPMAELNSAGTWSDYIYANGEKIAKVDSQKPTWHLSGVGNGNTSCGTATWVGPATGLLGLQLQTGDRLAVDMKSSNVMAGLGLYFSDGSFGDVSDQNGVDISFFGDSGGQWAHRVFDLDGFAGKTIAGFPAGLQASSYSGQGDLWIDNLVLTRANGSVIPVYTGNAPVTMSMWGTGEALGSTPIGTCNYSNLTLDFNTIPLTDPTMSTSYFLDDHLGTAQMELSGGGWPMWTGQFTPFGLELPDGNTDMHYKFTGKERDSETGLDFFGARYYASPLGRWNSPDWADKPEAVPYSNLRDPQSLNLYQYVGNHPLSQADKDGHCIWDGCIAEVVVGALVAGLVAKGIHDAWKWWKKTSNDIDQTNKNYQLILDSTNATDAADAAQKVQDGTVTVIKDAQATAVVTACAVPATTNSASAATPETPRSTAGCLLESFCWSDIFFTVRKH